MKNRSVTKVLEKRRRLANLILIIVWTSALPIVHAQQAGKPAETVGGAGTTGTIVTVAGTGQAGFSGDNGPAKQAQIHAPHNLKVDAAGNVIIADLRNHRVRKIRPDGIITTIAGFGLTGAGQGGYSGDGGLATEARMNGPNDVAPDVSGDLIIADSSNHRVRRVSPDGIITNIAGKGTEGFSGDGGPATLAQITRPSGLLLDDWNNLFVSERSNGRARRVSPNGVITTILGNGIMGYSGDGGPAVEASFTDPHGFALDLAGNLLVVDFEGHLVRKIDSQGIVTTVAGNGFIATPGFFGDGGPASAAQLNRPHCIAIDSAGNLFIADYGNHRVRKVTPDGIITTVAGNGGLVFSGEGGPATEAGLRGPLSVAIDAAGNLFIADSGIVQTDGLGLNERILKVFGVAAPGRLQARPFPVTRDGVFYFPQVAGGGGNWTAINLTNPSTTKVAIAVVSFFGSDGKPLGDVVDNPALTLTIPPSSTVRTATNSQGSVRSGYARVTASDPVIANVTYTLGDFRSPAVDPSTSTAFVHLALVARDISAGLETGVAIVNVSNTGVRLVLSILDSSGNPLQSHRTSALLAPGEQLSRSLGELMPLLPPKFVGTLRVTALSPLPSQAIAVTAVHFRPGHLKVAPLTLLDKAALTEEDIRQ